ncbi:MULTISPECIES: IS21-like element helper ATPase IstB [Rhizobium]|uniref:Insertion sequence ATP-binding protein y4uH n=1 Tax=Rhizobium favelukesii TaxID=348824 RepID=W6RH71_9HYPH|nr:MULTISPECIES: IS21-like element helper ATPase IstB [Rhizobium]MCS0462778.1 IS21-like element helper ATPase IstB [Rhizobium favelukesii]UFS84984.1 IS21-like element helper ATPase IstB [Rhizobium sp. T136]CDM60154.1 putative insertion sequence ATP-binding protein y4uH [Rhizobium favelukesii]
MLKHPTLNLLQQLGLAGMAEAFARLTDNEDSDNLSHGEWLALLLDQEATWRNNKRLALRLRNAKLHHPAVPEDIIRRAPREYDRSILDLLVAGDWIRKHENCAIVGPTGIGKSWLACALGHKACRDNHSVLYVRMPALLQSLEQARGIGNLAARLKSLGSVELLILDDYGLQPIDGNAPHYLLEILEGRYGRRSTLVTSQFPVARWHEKISDPTYADAILDRLVHNAHRLEMSGESMRRLRQSAEIQT